VKFTPRELEVLAGLVRGDLQVMIADRLGISESRVEVLVSNIKGKLKSPTCTSAAAKAVKLGIVDPFDVE
jgi:DNA-binding NarL/FixJ family response regulator